MRSKGKVSVYCIVLIFVLLLSACGKNIPVIDPELLQTKQSVLVISRPGLSGQAAEAIQKMLLNWRDSRAMAFEWMKDTETIGEEQLAKIKSAPYNFILVIGNGLNRQAAPQAAAITDKRWILLDDEIAREPLSVSGDHIAWKMTGEGFMEQQWQEWVKQQQVAGKRIEWVTVSSNPIPSLWAPSEEAEYISLADAQGWYSQFQYQVKQHRSDWIAVYSPLDEAILQRMKSLQVPIMNMAVTSVNIQWESLTASLFDFMQKMWVPGLQNYTPQEITVNKPQ